MRIYYDTESGNIRYTISIDPTSNLNPPGTYIEVSDSDQDIASIISNLDDWKVIEGSLVRTSLEWEKQCVRNRLLEIMAQARTQMITVLPGQDLVYQAKEAEARSWISEESPLLQDYPLLSAEVGITAPTADELAQLWLNMGALLREAASYLEAFRMTTNNAITAAENSSDLQTILSTIESFQFPPQT